MKKSNIFTIILVLVAIVQVFFTGYIVGNWEKRKVEQILDVERFSALRCQKIKGVLTWDNDIKRVFCWSNPSESDIEQMKEKEAEYKKFNNYVCGEPSKRLLCR